MNLSKTLKLSCIALVVLFFAAPSFGQNLKIGYVHSQKILATYKDALDAQKKLDDINRQWETEGMELQQKIQTLREQYEAQSLLLSEAKKKEKEQELQGLILQLQKFQRDKWDPQGGEILRKQAEIMQPVYDKINGVIKKIGDADKFSLIFDTATSGLLYANDDMPDLTDRVLEELNKGQAVKSDAKSK